MAGCRLAWWTFTCPDTARARFASVTSDLKTTSRLDGCSSSSGSPHTHLQLNNLYQELLYLSPLATTPKQAPKTWPVSLYSKREVLFYICAESYSKSIWNASCLFSVFGHTHIYSEVQRLIWLLPCPLSPANNTKPKYQKFGSSASIQNFRNLSVYSKHTWTLSMSLRLLLVLTHIWKRKIGPRTLKSHSKGSASPTMCLLALLALQIYLDSKTNPISFISLPCMNSTDQPSKASPVSLYSKRTTSPIMSVETSLKICISPSMCFLALLVFHIYLGIRKSESRALRSHPKKILNLPHVSPLSRRFIYIYIYSNSKI